jgi:integrase
MASLYKRGSFWWIEYRDASGTRCQKSTQLRHGVPHEARQARRLLERAVALELQKVRSGSTGELFAHWVPRFLDQRYADSPLTHTRVLIEWRTVADFLRGRGVTTPRQVSRQLCRDFLAWREVIGRARSTALNELKTLAVIMHEALQSGFCESNPCLKLGLSRSAPRKKPAINLAEHHKIIYELRQLRKLVPEREWMLTAYRIGYWQGCRLSETSFPLAAVDLARNVIRLRTKGKGLGEFPLSPRLRPLFRNLISSVTSRSLDLPAGASGDFARFFRSIGLGHITFHSTRVSFITRCHEAGIPQEHVMRLCGHCSTTVHQIYVRLPASGNLLQDLMRQSLNK